MPELAEHGIARLRADNPSAYTLDGTNTWVIGRDPAWVVDPGPALDAHLDAVAAEVAARGGAGGIALTHDHADHAEAVPALRDRLGGPPVAAARYPGDVALADGDAFGPLRAVAIPGHADDHLAFVAGAAAFTGDAVLGEGSVFVTSRLGEYLEALERLRGLRSRAAVPGPRPARLGPGRQARRVSRPPRRARAQAARGAGGGRPHARTSCSTRRGPTRPPRCGARPR